VTAGPDRKNALAGQTVLTGIDFVKVHSDQVTLDVFFQREPAALVPALTIDPADVMITGEDEDVPVPVVSAAWFGPIDGRTVLRVVTSGERGWGRYWLAIAGARIDPFFASIELNFKVACPSKLDCELGPHECPPEHDDHVVVDGSARDFWSLRRALLEFAQQRHPRWQTRLAADAGVMVIELMAALGDELSYYQDRIARETHFDTAAQRRSLRRHVRLVDYDLHDGLGARGWVAIEATAFPSAFSAIPAGTSVWARSDGGKTVGFELGNGLAEVVAGTTYRIHPARNKLEPHIWDADPPDARSAYRPMPLTCLEVGATAAYLKGHHAAHLSPGERVFLVTEPPIQQRDKPLRRLLVTLRAIEDVSDPLGGPAQLNTEVDVTRIEWYEPLPFELNLDWLSVLGNAAPVTAGITQITDFSIGPSTQDVPVAIERAGADRSIAFMHTLPDDRGTGVVRLGPAPRVAAPEVDVVELSLPSGTLGPRWEWRPTLIGSNSSESQDAHYTLDDGTWDRMVGYQRLGGEVVHHDYLAGIGATIRFGDGEFGRMPARGNARPGEDRFFRARYRLGNGRRSNLPADALRWADPTGKQSFADLGLPIVSITNPLATAGGVDPETTIEAKRDAPEAFRAVTYRAVRPDDYSELAERLPWVQNAGTQFRWTGSWMAAFTTVDPRRVDELPADRRTALTRYLDRYRMAGGEVHVLEPRYADLDLEIKVCVEPESYPADVRADIVLALVGKRGVRPVVGFFHPDHFTFGTPLDRSELEARVQRVPGVRAVKAIRLRRLGYFPWRPFLEPYWKPGIGEIVRIDNDPRRPDRGSVHVFTEGGA